MEKAFALKHTAILDAAGDLLHSGYKDLQTGECIGFIKEHHVCLFTY